MPSTPLAYNPSLTPIDGTTQIGTLAVGTSNLDYSSSPGGVTWWMGPDESDGYVIGTPVTSQNFPTPLGNIGTVQFWKSADLTEESFKTLAEIVTGQSFVDSDDAKTYLNNNNYWTSWASTYKYSASSFLSWPSSSTGYTLYNGGFTNSDDGFSNSAISLPVAFSVNGSSSSNLYISTNGYFTLGSGSGTILSFPTQSSPAVMCANPADLWMQPGLGLTDGDTQNAYYQTGNDGGDRRYVKLLIYQGTYQATTTPKSWIGNFYRDNTYQWFETRVKLNAVGNSGPYNAISVSQPSSTTSRVWRGDLNGQNWTYMGTGSVIP